jgi:hypothetical protein
VTGNTTATYSGTTVEACVNETLEIVLYVIAALCFAAAAFTSRRRTVSIDLVAAGLLAWVLVHLLSRLS